MPTNVPPPTCPKCGGAVPYVGGRIPVVVCSNCGNCRCDACLKERGFVPSMRMIGWSTDAHDLVEEWLHTAPMRVSEVATEDLDVLEGLIANKLEEAFSGK